MNLFIGTGRLCANPELSFLNTGTAVAKFTLAIDRNLSKEKKQEAESKNQPTADFIRITVWGKQAENCANYLEKGRLVAIQGRVTTGSYAKEDGSKVYTTEITATNVEFLEFKNSNSDSSSSVDYGIPEGFHPTDSDSIPF